MGTTGAPARFARSLGVILVAAGSGTRFGAEDKIFTPLAGRPIVQHSLETFAELDFVDRIVVVFGLHTLERGKALIARMGYRNVIVCEGGATRAESVRAGLAAMPASVDLIAVHDAARPLVSAGLIQRVLVSARAVGAAIPASGVSDTVHEIDAGGYIVRTPERSRLVGAQTPQIARRDWLDVALREALPATDEAGSLCAAGFQVGVVDGDPVNIKITWPEDVSVAEALIRRRTEGLP